jgi:hypothetical protein
VAPRLLAGGLRAMQAKRFVDWSFGHYLNVAHPDFVAGGARARRPPTLAGAGAGAAATA